MLILEVTVLIVLFIGILYVGAVLCFAKKVQHQEFYEAEKELKEWRLLTVKDIDLEYVEQVTKELNANGFTWVEDYKLQEKDSEYIKLSRHQNAVVECYVRYLVNESASTVASIAFYKAYPRVGDKDIWENQISYMHCFTLETGLKDNKHLKSCMRYAPSEGAEIMDELLEGPQDKCKVYTDKNQIQEMIVQHLRWVHKYNNKHEVDSTVTVRDFKEVLTAWWARTYELRKDIYCYHRRRMGYKLTFVYCIKVVLCYPFFELFNEKSLKR